MQALKREDKKPLIEHIAEWITQREAVWPLEVIQRTEHALADTVACIVAGASDPVVLKARVASQQWGTGRASVIGGDTSLPALAAALVNGTAAHVLEIDDNYYPALTHASAVIVPALLAIAEEEDCRGRELIDAYVVGLEIHALLGRGINRSHYYAGWHPTATIGCIGTAAACARLLRLDLKQTVATLSIATSMACGNKAQFGTEVKSLQCGIAASNSIKAARLAQAGIQGNPDVLEDPQGFLSLYGGPNPRGWAEPLLKLDNPLAMQEYGLAPKRHACCGSAHNTLDSILVLMEQHKFTAKDVSSVEVLIGASNRKNLRYDNPADEFQARFSMNYNVALILFQGKVTLEDFTPEAIKRPEIRDLLSLTTTNARSFEDEPLDPDDRPPHLVKIILKDGRVLEQSRIFAKGLIQDPFSDEDRRQKLIGCCESVLGLTRMQELEEKLKHISAVSVRDLMSLLR